MPRLLFPLAALVLGALLPLAGALAPARADDDPTKAEPPSSEEPGAKPAAQKEAEPAANPVVVIETSQGEIVVELLRAEAPRTVETFLALALGTQAFKDLRQDPSGATEVTRPFYDGLTFHRVIPGFMIQGGCPLGTGASSAIAPFADEINATALGLEKVKAFEGGRPHPWLAPSLQSQAHFQQLIVLPLLKRHGIDPSDRAAIQAKAPELDKELMAMSLKQVYELMGYRYSDSLRSRPVVRGVLAMANAGPNTNGTQFFVTVGDAPWLNGKHTVFGCVIGGLEVADRISNVKRGPNDAPAEAVLIRRIRLRP